MDATPIDRDEAHLLGASGAMAERTLPDALSMKWSALHDAAGVAAAIAGVLPVPLSQEARTFPMLARACGVRRRALAERGVADLIAVLEPGLAGLLSAHARGAQLQAAARALWSEFVAARDALVAMVAIESI